MDYGFLFNSSPCKHKVGSFDGIWLLCRQVVFGISFTWIMYRFLWSPKPILKAYFCEKELWKRVFFFCAHKRNLAILLCFPLMSAEMLESVTQYFPRPLRRTNSRLPIKKRGPIFGFSSRHNMHLQSFLSYLKTHLFDLAFGSCCENNHSKSINSITRQPEYL